MNEDVLRDARAALAAGRCDEALRLAWQVTMPAVLNSDADQLARSAAFAEEVASVTSGRTKEQARQQAAYWSACIEEPRSEQSSAWNVRSWFRRAPAEKRYPCPQCAELILVDAKVCRFCGLALTREHEQGQPPPPTGRA